MLAHILITSLAAAAVVSAAPTSTSPATATGHDLPSRTVPLTGVTHTVAAGRGGALAFDPENVVAAVGDVVEWHFLPRNHSVARSSFAAPCRPDPASDSSSSFFSGFLPAPAGAPQAADVFQLVVEDARPVWYYCAQTAGAHCQAGMAGVVNQDFGSADTLAAYKAAAAGTGASVVPPAVRGGRVLPNPNPLGGI